MMQCCGYKPNSVKANINEEENCASHSTDQQAPHSLRLSNNYMPLQAPPEPNFSDIAARSSAGLVILTEQDSLLQTFLPFQS